MNHKIYIIGIGPGTKDYLLPVAKKEIEKADCLIGARRILSLFQHMDKEKIYLKGNFNKIISYIKNHRLKKRIAILVSGDPGLYSFLVKIQSAFNKEDYCIIPGISSLQLAFARIGEMWQDVKIISLHGRKLNNLLKQMSNHKKIFIFTDSQFSPQRIAKYLLNKGVVNRKVIIFENLSYPDEKIIETDLHQLSKMHGFGLCVMLIK